jgi:molybdopterin-guanine dinucleotide biosynthesis protein A
MIIERQVRVLRPLVDEIMVSGAVVAGHRTVHDEIAGLGPLAGIAAGLAAAKTPWLLVVAGDMPYITSELIAAMLARVAPDLDAVGVRSRDRPEPLLCVLHTRTRTAIERRLATRRFKASGLLLDEGLRVAWLDDPDPRALVNLNTPDDLREPHD